MDDPHLADGFLLEEFDKLRSLGMAAVHERFHEKDIVLSRRVNNRRRFGMIQCQRFFAEDVFTQIKDYIGKDQSSYKVASLALYSSIPLYNGFYCIDGYSNNYSLEYKTEFRKIIEKELNKNKTIQSYYDDWGNRCYLFTAQLGTAYVFEKDNSTKLTDLELNTNQLKEMGCDYIFSGVEIASAKQKGLAFVKSFESKDSMWRIYVYEVKSVGITN